MNIVLIGFMGVGKSSVGRRLAKRIGYRLLDTDACVENERGKKISEIFASNGESGFREMESELLDRLANLNNTVISTGGGILTTPGNLERLRRLGPLIYLKADLEEIYKRVISKKHRPLIQNSDDPQKTLADLLVKRSPLYEQADHVIETCSLGVNRVAGRIIELL